MKQKEQKLPDEDSEKLSRLSKDIGTSEYDKKWKCPNCAGILEITFTESEHKDSGRCTSMTYSCERCDTELHSDGCTKVPECWYESPRKVKSDAMSKKLQESGEIDALIEKSKKELGIK